MSILDLNTYPKKNIYKAGFKRAKDNFIFDNIVQINLIYDYETNLSLYTDSFGPIKLHDPITKDFVEF